jgi:hypothetical protein
MGLRHRRCAGHGAIHHRPVINHDTKNRMYTKKKGEYKYTIQMEKMDNKASDACKINQ